MIGLFGGFVLLLIILAFAYAVSIATTFWFISIPLFCLWIYSQVKRDQRREAMPLNPAQQAAKAKAQADIDRFQATQATYRQIAKDERNRMKGR